MYLPKEFSYRSYSTCNRIYNHRYRWLAAYITDKVPNDNNYVPMPPTVSQRLKTSACFSASGIEASSLSITTRVRERKSKANSLDSSFSIALSILNTILSHPSIDLFKSRCRKRYKRSIFSLKIFQFFKFNDNTQFFSRFWEFSSLKFYILAREGEIYSREKWKRVIVREFYSWRKSFLIIVNNRSMWLW